MAFKKRHIPWNKNLTKETDGRVKKLALQKVGDKNHMWKGDKVSYRSLHKWIKNHKPKPKFCENCGVKLPYDLANISGKYKRDINDFEWLCRSCHMKKDGRMKNLLRNEKRKHKGKLILCTKCKEFKTKEEFYKDQKIWDGLTLSCKDCYKKHYQENKERIKGTYSIENLKNMTKC